MCYMPPLYCISHAINHIITYALVETSANLVGLGYTDNGSSVISPRDSCKMNTKNMCLSVFPLIFEMYMKTPLGL